MAHAMTTLGYVPFTFFLHKSEKAAIKRAAKEAGVPMSRFVLNTLAKKADFEVKERKTWN